MACCLEKNNIAVGENHRLLSFLNRQNLNALLRMQGLNSKDAKFACKDRAALLTVLYQTVAAAVARGTSGIGPTFLGYVELSPQ